jgi:hypothetical protein
MNTTEKEYVMVETIVVQRLRYLVDSDTNDIERAIDTVHITKGIEPLSIQFVSEEVFDTSVITKTTAREIYNIDNPNSENIPFESAIDLVVTRELKVH